MKLNFPPILLFRLSILDYTFDKAKGFLKLKDDFRLAWEID